MVDVSAILIFRQSYLTSLRSVLQTMTEKARAVVIEQPGQSGSPATAELNAKQDILGHVKESIDQVYMDFESVEVEPEDAQPSTGDNPKDTTEVAGKIDEFIQTAKPVDDKGSSSDSLKSLAEEFSVIEKKSPAIDANLTEIVKSLINEKLPKEKLSEVQAKYLSPENCTDLVVPKINKQIWQQLRQDTRNSDSAFQKAQSQLISGLYAILQMCNSQVGNKLECFDSCSSPFIISK